ncbi:hypothetical protein [Acidocella sp.]|uniref:hypothetical protein n=1 Tax=Acidocella sp. TaxID=50710 RepID=UPI002602A4DD|nr:hypothetical protein [Acidocella sp.]
MKGKDVTIKPIAIGLAFGAAWAAGHQPSCFDFDNSLVFGIRFILMFVAATSCAMIIIPALSIFAKSLKKMSGQG